MARSTRQININQADFDLIKSNLKTFLDTDPRSPFYNKNYNYESSALSGIIDTASYLIHYLSYTLNKNISEIFIDTVILEDNIYSLLNNYNYTPQLKRPANSFIKFRYFRNTNNTLTVTSVAGLSEGETLTGLTSGATGTIYKIDAINNLVFLSDVVGTFSVENVDNGTITVACSSVSSDYYSDDEDKDFSLSWNKAKYTDEFYIIPTFRDKVQEEYYDDANVNDFYDENIVSYQMEPYIDSTTGYRYLQLIMTAYQADWASLQQTITSSFVNSPKIRLNDSNGDSYDDEVIIDSVRVYVQENGFGDWIEYTDIKKGYVNESQINFNGGKLFALKYVPDDGVYVEFNISYISRTMSIGDKVRIFFAVTEGDVINTVSGTNVFTNAHIKDITITDITDESLPTIILDSTNYGSTLSAGVADWLAASLILDDSPESGLDVLDNGQAKQDIESIRETAPLYYTTQGRAITENDWNYIMKTHFSEYLDTICWGGDREFLDVEDIMDNAISWYNTTYGAFPTTASALAETLQHAQVDYYTDGELSIDTITASGINNGKYVKDVGHVYFSVINQNFKFINDTATINQVKSFFNDKKIMTIFMKYIAPTVVFLKPIYTCSVEPAYTNSIDLDQIKQNLYSDFNSTSKFNRVIYFSEIDEILENYDEINAVINKNYSVSLKVKNSTIADEWIYVRTYTRFRSDINTTILSDYGTTHTFITSGDEIRIDGYLVGSINKDLGLMKFKNQDGFGNQFFTDSDFIINGIVFDSLKINSVKDCYTCFRAPSDISINLI